MFRSFPLSLVFRLHSVLFVLWFGKSSPHQNNYKYNFSCITQDNIPSQFGSLVIINYTNTFKQLFCVNQVSVYRSISQNPYENLAFEDWYVQLRNIFSLYINNYSTRLWKTWQGSNRRMKCQLGRACCIEADLKLEVCSTLNL